MLSVDATKHDWSISLEGKICDGVSENDKLAKKTYLRFLELFSKIKVDFVPVDQESRSVQHAMGSNSGPYEPVLWEKNRFSKGANFDCLRIKRSFSDESSVWGRFAVCISMWLD